MRMMKKIAERMRGCIETLSLSALLVINLSFMVLLMLGLCTVLVVTGADGGFIYHDGRIGIWGALCFIYAVCSLIAVSMVVMMRMVFIHPLQRNIEAMKKLANGDFTVRVNHAEHGYVPREMVEFEQSFNKAAEELGGTEILRKDFINNFSHEFKTPIVSISGFADLLLEEQLPPEDQKEYLTIIRDESRRLADLATNILTLNRVESQTILTDKAAFPLDEQLRQSVLVTQQKWRQKELDFDADLAPAEYTGSEGLLKEVWLNLLDNAAKFSPEGGTVAVNLRKEKSALMVSVTDQGEGMSADTQAHIFEQFYQGDTSHTTQGNGLGLAMVKKVLELHGGSIQVNSAPGQGSCFTVTLLIFTKYIFLLSSLFASGSNFAGVLLAPGEVIFQNDRGADGIQNLLAAAAKGAALVQQVGGGAGGLALVPHAHRQAAPKLHGLCQLAAFCGTLALGAVHVQRQTDDDELGPDLFGYLAHPRGHLVAGLEGDLRGDGRGQEFGVVTGGKAGAAVSVING